jgi:hypothetical protein
VLQLEVVLDDAVVDDDDPPGAIAMGVGVFFRGTAVRGPARVRDAVAAVDRLVDEDLLEVAQLAGRPADVKLAAAVDHRDPCRVVAAVFELPQALDQDFNGVLRTDVPDDPAHG